MQREWVSMQERKVRIPARQVCNLAPDGSCCADCEDEGGVWSPKSQAGARTVPYKHSAIVVDVLHPFFSLHEEVGTSRQTVWRRVRGMATRAGIPHRVYPHALRATAATQFADMGLNEHELCAVMGWDDIRTARPYIRRSARNLEDALDRGKREGRAWL